MSEVWVTPAGFVRRTLQEIRAELEDGFRNIFGPDVDLSPEGVNGELISLMALSLANVGEGAQEIYTAHDPAMATGTSLDIIAALSVTSRIQAAAGTAACILYAEEAGNGTLIPAGRQVRRTRGGLLYSLLTPVTISRTACRDIYLRLDPFNPGAVLTLDFDFGSYSFTAGATELATYQALANSINANPGALTGQAQAYSSANPPVGAQFTTGNCLRVLSANKDFRYIPSAGWATPFIGSNGNFLCGVVGPESAAAGDITEIATPVAGWVRAYNQVPAQTGRGTETDEELRIRRAASFRSGLATEEAIRLQLLNRVPGIISTSITSNRSYQPDADGRPGKSFEVVADGGLNEDIAQVIWESQPAGIESFGNVEVEVVDSSGETQLIQFSRPEDKYLWMNIGYSIYSEEDFPADGETQIRAAVLAWAAQEYTLGKDIIPQRVFTPVFSVPGIGAVTVEVALTDDLTPPLSYTTSIIPVGGRARALLSSDRLTIAEVA